MSRDRTSSPTSARKDIHDRTPDSSAPGSRRLSRSVSTSSLFMTMLDPSPPPQSASAEAAISSLLREHTERKDQRIRRWLEEQEYVADDDHRPVDTCEGKALSPTCHPYLAYPQLAWGALKEKAHEDEISVADYVIVEEEETREAIRGEPETRSFLPLRPVNPTPPPTPKATTTFHAKTSRNARDEGASRSSPSWRSLHLPIPRSIRSSFAEEQPSTPPQTPRKSSIFRRAPIPLAFTPTSQGIESDTCLSLANPLPTPETLRSSRFKPFSSKGNSSLNISSTQCLATPPRPSISTESSQNTAVERPPAPLTSARQRSRFSFTFSRASSSGTPYFSDDLQENQHPSRHSLLSSAGLASRSTLLSPSCTSKHTDSVPTHIPSPRLTSKAPTMSKKTSKIFKEMSHNPSGTSSPGKSVVFSVPSSRRKKLVISGVERDDLAAIEGVRKWCETFGELRQITRVPNGDLHIDFRKADVADSVCRIHAGVYITGVGSVILSWYTGRKP